MFNIPDVMIFCVFYPAVSPWPVSLLAHCLHFSSQLGGVTGAAFFTKLTGLSCATSATTHFPIWAVAGCLVTPIQHMFWGDPSWPCFNRRIQVAEWNHTSCRSKSFEQSLCTSSLCAVRYSFLFACNIEGKLHHSDG